MKLLVTGANGQLGNEFRQLARSASDAHFTFVDIDELDITDEQSVKDFFVQNDFDFVVNCAAYTAVDRAEEESAAAYKVNADAVKFLAAACANRKVRMFHISTDYVFDGLGNNPIAEKQATNPLSVYGKSKLEGERHALTILQDAYIIRTAWVYSTYGKNFVKTISKFARERDSLNVVADQFGSPTHAGDLAFAIMHMIRKVHSKEKDVPGVYHFSNEGAISWYDFAWFIVKHYGLPCRVNPISTEEYKTLAVRPKFSVLNKRHIKDTFGVTVPHWYESLVGCLNKLEL